LQIDNSSLERFNTCPKSAYWYLVKGKETAGRNAATEFGRCIHHALERRYELDGPGAVNNETIRECNRLIQQFFIDSPAGIEEWRNQEQAIMVFSNYISTYLDEPWEIISLERPFSLPLMTVEVDAKLPMDVKHAAAGTQVDEIDVYWTGRIDMLVKHNEANRLVDHKTTSVLGPTYWRAFDMSQQMEGYCWAAEQITGQNFNDVIINVLASRRPTKTGKKVEFARENFHYTPLRIDRWRENTKTLVAGFIQDLFENSFAYKTAWCVGKYGTCPYHDVCKLDTEAQQEITINSGFYQDVTWTPLEN